jgi:hypothetical protein
MVVPPLSLFSRELAGQRAKRAAGIGSAATPTAWRDRASAWTCSFHRKPRPSRWKRQGAATWPRHPLIGVVPAIEDHRTSGLT